MTASPIPRLAKSELVDSSSWSHYRAALRLAEAGSVRRTEWNAPILSGEVDDGERLRPKIDFTSTVLLRGSCSCGQTKGAQLCRHAVALYLVAAGNGNGDNQQSAAHSAAPTGAQMTPGVSGRPAAPLPMQIDGTPAWLAARLPSRDSSHYQSNRALLRDESFQLDPRSARWFLRGRHKVLSFLARYWQQLSSTGAAVAGDGLKTLLKHVVFPKLECEAVATKQGVTVRAEFVVPIDGVNSSELIGSAVQQGRYYSECGDQIVLVDPADLERMTTLQAGIAGDSEGQLSHRFRHTIAQSEIPYVDSVLDAVNPGWKGDDEWQRLAGPLKSLSALQPAPMEPRLDEMLRTYQRVGVAWMWHLYGLGLGGILADEMGLGKTVQAVALIGCALRAKSAAAAGDGVRADAPLPALVVCPAGLVENWCREIRRFAPHLPLVVHHRGNRINPATDPLAGAVVVTSYSTLAVDQDLFSGTRWAVIIGDEAQHIKNRRTQSAGVLRRLQANGRFLLTGTPVENRIEDLCSLFEFLLPGYLDASGRHSLGGSERGWSREAVQQRAAPYILRRTKSGVAPELPEKIEQTVYCEMEPRQQQLYREFTEQSGRSILDLELSGANEGRIRMEVLKQILRLRQICADPRLIEPEFQAADSTKWNVLREILNEARDGGHRVLVFSQFVQLLKRVRHDLEQSGWSCAYLDGSTRNRMAEVDRFQNDPNVEVFLISLKAGGTGLNLTAADTVIHLDPWWNPATEAQATDRAHRIGQTRRVTSLKLIVAGSIEERILALQAGKAALLEAVLEAGDATTGKLTLDELKELIT